MLGHTEDLWQWAPLVLMAASLVTLGWREVARGARSLRVFRGTMVLFVLSGWDISSGSISTRCSP